MLRTALTFRQRKFSSSSLVTYDWLYRGRNWEVQCTVISPVISEKIERTILLLPSMTLVSSKEEWRECAEYLADLGYRSIIADWPGWSTRSGPLNWALEDDISQDTNSSWIFTDFTCSLMTHSSKAYPLSPMSLVAAGGIPLVHSIRAIKHLSSRNDITLPTSIVSFSPTWKYYLIRYLPEGFPRKLGRRRVLLSWILSSSLIRSRTLFKLYTSKYSIAKVTRSLYEGKIQHDEALFNSKRNVLLRDRPLQIDRALVLGHLNPVKDSQEYIQTILSVLSPNGIQKTESNSNDDSDDDDSLLNIKVPDWTKTTHLSCACDTHLPLGRIALSFVIPEDVVDHDRREMELVQEWIGNMATIKSIPGRLACHEESPALSATLIHELVCGSV